MIRDELKYKILSLVQLGLPIRDIVERTGTSYSDALKLRREFEEHRLNNTLASVYDMDKLALATIADELPEVSESAAKLTKGLDGLERLSGELQQTALVINSRVKSAVMQSNEIGELRVAADIICLLQTSFLNKNLTQVNVQNNFGDTPKYTQYLSDQPAPV